MTGVTVTLVEPMSLYHSRWPRHTEAVSPPCPSSPTPGAESWICLGEALQGSRSLPSAPRSTRPQHTQKMTMSREQSGVSQPSHMCSIGFPLPAAGPSPTAPTARAEENKAGRHTPDTVLGPLSLSSLAPGKGKAVPSIQYQPIQKCAGGRGVKEDPSSVSRGEQTTGSGRCFKRPSLVLEPCLLLGPELLVPIISFPRG